MAVHSGHLNFFLGVTYIKAEHSVSAGVKRASGAQRGANGESLPEVNGRRCRGRRAAQFSKAHGRREVGAGTGGVREGQ